jgi:hypothetical protein
MARTVEQLESLQRAIAKPVPVRFVIRRLKADQ